MSNVDQAELEKFSQVAHKWWDTSSEFKPLMISTRCGWTISASRLAAWPASAVMLDVGCGGGILSEGLARAGAEVLASTWRKKVAEGGAAARAGIRRTVTTAAWRWKTWPPKRRVV